MTRVESMYLLDTSVWVDLLRTNSQSIRQKLMDHSESRIGLSVITYCELQYGVERHAMRHPHMRSRNQELLSTLITPFEIFPLEPTSVLSYGKLRTNLESRGALIGALDMFIAAQALSLGATLVTSNEKGFRQVPNLAVENWR